MVVEGPGPLGWLGTSGGEAAFWKKLEGLGPPIHLADGAPGGCLAMSCKCVGIYLGLDLRPIPGIVRSCH